MNPLWSVRMLCAVAIALAFACSGASDAPVDAAVVKIETLELRVGGDTVIPSEGTRIDERALASLGGFRSVTLPDYWPLMRRRRVLEGWYRAGFEVVASPTDCAIAVEGTWDSLQVYVNGERLVEATAADRPAQLPLLAAATVLMRVQPALLRAGANEVALRFVTRPDEIGSLQSIAVGPAHVLAARQRNTTLWTATLPSLLALFGLSCGLLVLMLTRWSLVPGTFALGFGTTLWSSAALLAPLAASPSSPFGDVIATAAHAFPPCIALGFLYALGLRRRRVEATLIGSIAVGAGVRALVAPVWIPVVDNLWWIVNAAIGLYLIRLAIVAVRRNALPVPRLLLAASVIVIGAGIFDLATLFAGRSPVHFSLFVATSPLIGLATAAGLVVSLARALDSAHRLNVNLEQRVEEKRRELDASYARTAILERARAIAGERERMMRDMHDGTGGQLVSALAMVEGGEVPRDEVAEALREALSDLRLVIDSLEPGEPDLLALLAHARARLEPRLERHGLRFAWQVEDVPAPARFGPEQSLHLMRVFQEAVTNAVKHARATTISVRTGTARDAGGRACAFVEVADDGCGFGAAPNVASGTIGRGLRNMRRRAEELDGELIVSSVAQGTAVRLLLPLRDPS
jgi:signal transduction histidine kinase